MDRAAYRAAHAEELATKQRDYYAAHRTERLAYAKRYAQANRARITAYWLAWTKAHPESHQAAEAKRRARKRSNGGNVTAQQWRDLKSHYGQRCVYCHRKMARLTMDHITPLSQGGRHTIQNIVPACLSCNSKKQAGPVLSPIQPVLLL